MMAGWMNRQQQRDIHAKAKRIRFSAGQRRRLAEKGRDHSAATARREDRNALIIRLATAKGHLSLY